MKLYATVTSERARKGQGGNKFIDFRVNDELRHDIASVFIEVREDEIYCEMSCNDETGEYPKQVYSVPLRIKGKRQKGECPEGGNHFTVREGNEEICRKCLMTI